MLPSRMLLSAGESQVIFPPGTDDRVGGVPLCLLSEQQHTIIDYDAATRAILMVTPQERGSAIDQAWEVMSTIRAILRQQAVPMSLVQQSVFVRDPTDIAAFDNLMRAYFGEHMPATNYVLQRPCGGQALAIEGLAIGGHQVRVRRLAADTWEVQCEGIRWVYFAGITPPTTLQGAFAQTEYCLKEFAGRLKAAACTFRDVPRIWFYQGGITSAEHESCQSIVEQEAVNERYRELNRARTNYFDLARARNEMIVAADKSIVYPASTGIGTEGKSLLVSALAMQTSRSDVELVRLENPMQTSAYDYSRQFSVSSPKFSRAMALVTDKHTTIWVSGTASIVNSETVHPGDVVKQTHQTIDNIERLIERENFARHGYHRCGATLGDLAKVRVYVKHAEDFAACRQVCRERLPELPTIYAHADICRPELLVEIEGVAFTPTIRTPKSGV